MYAQGSGNLSGTVVDKTSGEKLLFSNVRLEGTSFGISTDGEGKFILRQIPAGDYNLIATYIGYLEQKMPVTVVAGITTEVTV